MVLGIYLNAVWEYVQRNPLIVVVLFLLIRKFTAAATPFPESGGRVFTAHGTNYFDDSLAAASKKGNLMICDFYATWCPPCRAAAPVFGRLSERWGGVDFVKVDVDECKSLAQREGVTAMPTFKIYRQKECVHTIRGFNEAAIVEQLSSLGARETAQAPADPAKTQ